MVRVGPDEAARWAGPAHSGPGAASRSRILRRLVETKKRDRPAVRSVRGRPSRADGSHHVHVRTRLFDADHRDHQVELTPTIVDGLSDRQLLWVDVTGELDAVGLRNLTRSLPTRADDLRRTWADTGGPRLDIHGDYFALRVIARDQGRKPGEVLDLLAARDLVVTHHAGPLPFLDDLDQRIESDTALGQIDSTGFVAAVLEAFVTANLERLDDIEAAVDRLDTEALRTTSRDLLDGMVEVRHGIALLRRQLAAHRDVFAALAGADFEAIVGSGSTAHLQRLADRLQSTIEAVDASREALVGTFDIHMTRTAQRTNDIMKTLTMVNVLLLPAAVVAGFMGMNEKPPWGLDDPAVFWIVVALLVVIALGTVLLLRVRRWI